MSFRALSESWHDRTLFAAFDLEHALDLTRLGQLCHILGLTRLGLNRNETTGLRRKAAYPATKDIGNTWCFSEHSIRISLPKLECLWLLSLRKEKTEQSLAYPRLRGTHYDSDIIWSLCVTPSLIRSWLSLKFGPLNHAREVIYYKGWPLCNSGPGAETKPTHLTPVHSFKPFDVMEPQMHSMAVSVLETLFLILQQRASLFYGLDLWLALLSMIC